MKKIRRLLEKRVLKKKKKKIRGKTITRFIILTTEKSGWGMKKNINVRFGGLQIERTNEGRERERELKNRIQLCDVYEKTNDCRLPEKVLSDF